MPAQIPDTSSHCRQGLVGRHRRSGSVCNNGPLLYRRPQAYRGSNQSGSDEAAGQVRGIRPPYHTHAHISQRHDSPTECASGRESTELVLALCTVQTHIDTSGPLDQVSLGRGLLSNSTVRLAVLQDTRTSTALYCTVIPHCLLGQVEFCYFPPLRRWAVVSWLRQICTRLVPRKAS
jgi:hypothetical protein